MKTWIKKNWKSLSTGFPITGMVISILLDNDKLGAIFILFSLLWVCILAFLYMVKDFSDKKPLPLTDFRKVEGIEAYSKIKLYELYMEETNRCVSYMMYEMMTPSEQQYVDWLELQATKFLILKGTKSPSKPKLDIDYSDKMDKINMEDL